MTICKMFNVARTEISVKALYGTGKKIKEIAQ